MRVDGGLQNLHLDTSPQGMGRDAHWRTLDLTSMSFGESLIFRPQDRTFDIVRESDHVLTFDIEIHDLAASATSSQIAWIQGQFGHPCRFQSSFLKQLRMV